MDSEVPRPRPTAPVSQLVRLLWGEDTTELQMSVAHIPHIVMYLSLKLDSESSQEEVSDSVVFSRVSTLSEKVRKNSVLSFYETLTEQVRDHLQTSVHSFFIWQNDFSAASREKILSFQTLDLTTL